MRAPDRRRRWFAVAALGLGLASLGLGAAPGVDAQVPDDLASQFGGFESSGRGNGFQLTYNVENVFPLPAPLFQASVPEAATTLQSGPSSTALGSVAYPGNLLVNLPSVIAQTNPEAGDYVPPYPVRTSVEHPSGPPEARQDVGSATSSVTASGELATAVTTMAGGDLPPFLRIGTITTSAQSALLEGALESRGRVVLSGIELLYGLIHIDSITTDLVATSDGVTAASDGGTVVTGATFLGQPATIGPDGVVVAPPPDEDDGDPSGPSTGGPLAPADGSLDPLGSGLSPALEPLNQALTEVLGSTNASVNDLLAASGISIRTIEPFESVDGSSAERTANGVVVDITYDGRGDNPLATLLAAIPADQLPGEGLPGFPLNTSPQALVNLLKETHVTGMALAYGNVNVIASPAFESPPVSTGGGTGSTSSGGGSSVGRTTPTFSTPAPRLPATPTAPGGGATTPVSSSPAGVLSGPGAGAAAVLLALFTSPLWAIGSRNLADNVLDVATSSCPDGLDKAV